MNRKNTCWLGWVLLVLIAALTINIRWIQASTASTLFLPMLVGGSGSGGGGDDGTTMTAEEQYAALVEVQSVLNGAIGGDGYEWGAVDPVEELDGVAAAIVALPDIVMAQVNTVSAEMYVVMRDGTSFTIIHSRAPEHSSATAPRPGVNAPSIPGEKKAIAVAYDGGADVASTVRQMLTDNGYEAAATQGASLNAMRGYKNLGVLHLDTHGAAFQIVAFNGNRVDPVEQLYGLQTSTSISSSGLENWKDELEAGELTISMSKVDKDDEDWVIRVAVTEKFIARHWSFDKGFVMLHTCFGGSNKFTGEGNCYGQCEGVEGVIYDASDVRNAILAAGADTVVGFDNYVNTSLSKPSILYMFDRMLGANSYKAQTPAQQPFPFAQVWRQMGANGDLLVGHPLINGAPKVVEVNAFGNTNDMILSPSIEQIVIDDHTGAITMEATIYGNFGDEEGTVEINGEELTVRSWANNEIEVRIKPEGDDTFGDVVVISADGFESNAVPITNWAGTIKYSETLGEGTLLSEIEASVGFKSSIVPFRTQIDAPATKPTETTYINRSLQSTATGSGEHIDGEDAVRYYGSTQQEVATERIIDSFYGAGARLARTQTGNVGGRMAINTEDKTAELCLYMNGYHTQQITTAQGSGEFQKLVSMTSGVGLEDYTRGVLPCFELTIEDDYTIKGDTYELEQGSAKFTLEISDLVPQGAPQE